MKWLAVFSLAALMLTGCVTQKQRAYITVTAPDGTTSRLYCTQRNTSLAMFGENEAMGKMDGVCGTFEGNATNIGFNEEGRKALEAAVKAAVKSALPVPIP